MSGELSSAAEWFTRFEPVAPPASVTRELSMVNKLPAPVTTPALA